MTRPEFLEPDIVLFLHDHALREFGGLQGLKIEGLSHSALGRVGHKLVHAEPGTVDLFTLAAAYAKDLASKPPFNDGKKRIAWSSCVLFPGVAAPDAIGQMPGLAAGRSF